MRSRLVLPAVLALALLSGCSGSPGPPGNSDYKADAERVCKDFVKKDLKAPATAKFSSVAAAGSGIHWTVTGDVDAQNSFGALLRNSFSCEVGYNSTDNVWSLISMTGLDS